MHLNDRFETFEVSIETTVGERTVKHRMEAPRIMIEQQFLGLMQDAANHPEPVRIHMTRSIPRFDRFQQKWVNSENSVTFINNAYISLHGEL